MKNLIDTFKNKVIENCKNENFKYRDWFVNDHLLIVEKLANELCDLYPNADRNIVNILVWFHDFGKPINENNEYETTLNEGRATLQNIGFSEEVINRVIELWKLMEKKEEIDISKQPIEVQIISGADGGSHFVGKFYSSYFRDDPEEKLEDIEARLKKKILKDWNKKMVLPELKKAFEQRYKRALEIVGEYPDKLM